MIRHQIIDEGVGVDLGEAETDVVYLFRFARDSKFTQHRLCHFLNMVTAILSQKACFGVKTNSKPG